MASKQSNKQKNSFYSTNVQCLLRSAPFLDRFLPPEGENGAVKEEKRKKERARGMTREPRPSLRDVSVAPGARLRRQCAHMGFTDPSTRGWRTARRHHDGWERQCLLLLSRDSKRRRRHASSAFRSFAVHFRVLRGLAMPKFRVTIDHPSRVC